jgi:hypothetical protein
MRRHPALLLVLAAFVIGGCGDDDSAKSQAQPTATPTPREAAGY